MQRGFWDKLKKPIFGLSPMDGVSDAPFRFMVAKYGKPDVMFTEFVNVEGMSRVEGERVRQFFAPFIYSQEERPIVAQVFGRTPELFYQSAVIVAELGFNGMDINMGCPVKKVSEKGAGAGLIESPHLAIEIVRQAKRGMEDWAEEKVSLSDLKLSDEARLWIESRRVERKREVLPVSVKTRIGVSKDVAEWWMEQLMVVEPAVVSLHGRTLKQMYMGRADWKSIAGAAQIVHEAGGMILGNGDVGSITDGRQKILEYGVDGVLIGRASFGNPGVFAGTEPTEAQRMSWLMEHANKYEELMGGDHFVPMRKHLAWYCREFAGASGLRASLMKVESVAQVEAVLKPQALPAEVVGSTPR